MDRLCLLLATSLVAIGSPGLSPDRTLPVAGTFLTSSQDDRVHALGSAAADGRRIAFSAIPNREGATDPECQNNGDTEIFTIKPDGRDLRRLTDNRVSDNWPSWSPSRGRIVFSSTARNTFNQDLWVMNADGKGRERLTDGPNRDFFPRWSPTGNRILFTRVFPTQTDASSSSDSRSIMIVRADGTNLRRLTEPSRASSSVVASWSPDGTRIVLSATIGDQRGFFVMRLRDRKIRLILEKDGDVYGVDWSPDGGDMTYSLQDEFSTKIYRVRMDGSRDRELTGYEQLISSEYPRWSPNGERLAFVGDESGCQPHVWRMREDGDHMVDILGDRDLEVYSVGW